MTKTTKKRLMLIEPPFYRLYKDDFCLVKYPLAFGYLAGVVLRDTDWEVQTYNADFRPNPSSLPSLEHMANEGYRRYVQNLSDISQPIWGEIEQAIRDFAPDAVGITSKTQNFGSARHVATIAKRLFPETTVILGGPHASMAGRDALAATADIDIAVVGEGEVTLVELLKTLEAGGELRSVEGILYRGDDGKVLATKPRDYIQDLDSLPFPHESAKATLKDFEHYPLSAFKYVFATRGCPYSCQFCGSRNIWSRKVRYRSPENVVEEMRRLRQLGLTSVHFDDDTFGIAKKNIFALCDAMRQVVPDVTWSCETTVNVLDEEVVRRMRAAGCADVQIGVESGSDEMLKIIRKNITIDKALAAAALLRRHGIRVQTFFIAGFPEETEETLTKTREAMRKIQSDHLIFSIYTPYPGTENYEICKDKGLIDDSYDVTLFNHQNPENCFTANIPPERFHVLMSEMMREVDQLNRVRRNRREWRERLQRARRSLADEGILPTLKRAARFAAKRAGLA